MLRPWRDSRGRRLYLPYFLQGSFGVVAAAAGGDTVADAVAAGGWVTGVGVTGTDAGGQA